jgi:conjugal transfer pilus assembly protein TraD
MPALEHLVRDLAIGCVAATLGGWAIARILRGRGLRWTWAALGFPMALLLAGHNPLVFWPILWGCVLACAMGGHWHHLDITYGADHAETARNRIGVLGALRRWSEQHAIRRHGWIRDGRLVIGRDVKGMAVSIPVGYTSGSHTLVVGATGSGKTVSEAWVAGRLIEAGHCAVVVDPKGDRMLRDELAAAASGRSVSFLEWTPEGPLAYNPYARGTDTEIADKALAGEQFTEPHYLRQAQRYLGHTVRVMHAIDIAVTPVSLMAHMDPRQLEVAARALPPDQARDVEAYLDSLGDRQRRDLAGVRDRLSILAESDIRQWLEPAGDRPLLDITQAVQGRAVVYFRLDADRRPLLAGMLASAIVGDLVTLVAQLQAGPAPTVVLIDEFSAVAADQVARLFGRARSAGVSMILGTQELADLKNTGDGCLREQTLGNVETVIAHRQNVPESAELIAQMAGTKPVWVTTQQTDEGLFGMGPSGRGTRRRGYEFEIHPSHIKRLTTGQAVVATPGSGTSTITYIRHPNQARQ